VRLTPLTPEIAIECSFLPPPLHSDPADRLLVATARALDVPIVTRDERILGYAEAGFVRAIGC
jgi:PIN domain nuclease of toxin-antitoxin system